MLTKLYIIISSVFTLISLVVIFLIVGLLIAKREDGLLAYFFSSKVIFLFFHGLCFLQYKTQPKGGMVIALLEKHAELWMISI